MSICNVHLPKWGSGGQKAIHVTQIGNACQHEQGLQTFSVLNETGKSPKELGAFVEQADGREIQV